jgi:hypothetical protein
MQRSFGGKSLAKHRAFSGKRPSFYNNNTNGTQRFSGWGGASSRPVTESSSESEFAPAPAPAPRQKDGELDFPFPIDRGHLHLVDSSWLHEEVPSVLLYSLMLQEIKCVDKDFVAIARDFEDPESDGELQPVELDASVASQVQVKVEKFVAAPVAPPISMAETGGFEFVGQDFAHAYLHPTTEQRSLGVVFIDPEDASEVAKSEGFIHFGNLDGRLVAICYMWVFPRAFQESNLELAKRFTAALRLKANPQLEEARVRHLEAIEKVTEGQSKCAAKSCGESTGVGTKATQCPVCRFWFCAPHWKPRKCKDKHNGKKVCGKELDEHPYFARTFNPDGVTTYHCQDRAGLLETVLPSCAANHSHSHHVVDLTEIGDNEDRPSFEHIVLGGL